MIGLHVEIESTGAASKACLEQRREGAFDTGKKIASGSPCTAVIIPTYNAEAHWPELEQALLGQNLPTDSILIIDSSSTDRTRELAEKSGFRLTVLPQAYFNHGGTRQLACTFFPSAEAIIMMTQDAVPVPGALDKLREALRDPKVGMAYGRQLPRTRANAIERHGRIFNYPEKAAVRTFEDRHRLGIRAAFCSNSFAVYRRTALEEVGGFPVQVIMGEDSYVAARMLQIGWNVRYVSDAQVIHSHPLTLRQEFARYFDTGVHHDRESWILESFGKVNGEGIRFLRSELRYLRRNAPIMIPEAVMRTVSKLAAYWLGKRWRSLPASVTRRLSASSSFWRV